MCSSNSKRMRMRTLRAFDPTVRCAVEQSCRSCSSKAVLFDRLTKSSRNETKGGLYVVDLPRVCRDQLASQLKHDSRCPDDGCHGLVSLRNIKALEDFVHPTIAALCDRVSLMVTIKGMAHPAFRIGARTS